MTDERRVRQHDVIYPHGVGAIMDYLGESFIAEDINRWPRESELSPIECKALSTLIDGARLRGPIVGDDTHTNMRRTSIPYMRFPQWLFCSVCGRVTNERHDAKRKHPLQCPENRCSGKLIPMRFVAVCEAGGHVQDIDWAYWTHARGSKRLSECTGEGKCLRRVTEDSGVGLGATFIECRSCGDRRSLAELNDSSILIRDGFKCRGRQPWEPCPSNQQSDCVSPLRPVLRTSTTVYRPRTLSALDIPWHETESDRIAHEISANPLFSRLKTGSSRGALLREMILEEVPEATSSDIDNALRAASTTSQIPRIQVLQAREWSAFKDSLEYDGSTKHADFDVRPADAFPMGYPESLSELIDSIGLVERLREVTALTGFTRYQQVEETRVDLGKMGANIWYPAVESFGEGIFIRLHEPAIQEWSENKGVRERTDRLRKQSMLSSAPFLLPEFGPALTPRYLLLHTLSHILIHRLEFQSGYTAASIRERIYSDTDSRDPQAGILIYTTSGDSAGTMGGLVRLGQPGSFSRVLLAALEAADCCSNDPVCMESNGQGPDGLNLAACHSCTLIPETSCTRGNLLLDRALLIGTEGVPGFFESVLSEARARIQ